jgi:hypothetical protein
MEGGREGLVLITLAIFQLFRGIHKLISYRKHRLQQSQLRRDEHNTVAPNLKIIITVNQRASYHQIVRKMCRLRFRKPAWHDAIDNKKYDDKINSEIWAHQSSLNPPLYIEVPVPIKGSERSCMCVWGIDFATFYNFLLNFATVPTMCYFFVFHFNTTYMQ